MSEKSSTRMRLKADEVELIKQVRSGLSIGQSEALLRKQVLELRSEVRALSQSSADFERLDMIFREHTDFVDKNPQEPWLTTAPSEDAGWGSGVLTLMISDWHLGEVTTSEQTAGVNVYNAEVAKQRLATVASGAVEMATQFKGATYHGIVLNLLGDLCHGELHDNREFNDLTSIQATVVAMDAIMSLIDTLRKGLGNIPIHVNGLCGNHDRMSTYRTKTKGATADSHAWLIYKLIERAYAQDPDITFTIPDSHSLLYRVYGRTFLASHGDENKGGNSLLHGVANAFMSAVLRKRKQWTPLGVNIDTAVWGHFHTYSVGQNYNYISNGCVCGTNEYSQKFNFGHERPSQTMFLTGTNGDIVWCLPVYAEKHSTGVKNPKWLEVHKGF